MKVKIISYNDEIISYNDGSMFEEAINMFIADKKVIGIQYQALLSGNKINDRALILYEDIDKS